MTLNPEPFEIDELEAALEAADLPDHAGLPTEMDRSIDFNPDDGKEISMDAPIDDMPTIVLPMQLSMLEDSARTDVGQQRDHNEDFFSLSTEVTKAERPNGRLVQGRGLYVLCDGMGGHAGGEVASHLAVETIQTFFRTYWTSEEGLRAYRAGQLPPSSVIREAIRLANQAIFDLNQADARLGNGRMGTTLVMMLLCNTSVAIAHVGDSRAYRYSRKHGLEQVTVDHEVGQREIQRGVNPEVAYGRPDAYQLTQALGPRDENFVEPDLTFIELAEDTLLLLASDGLTDNHVLENHVISHVDPMMSSQMNLDQGVRQLIDLANEVNGHDNITAIAIRAKVRPNLEQLR
jgi:protein phosphatase